MRELAEDFLAHKRLAMVGVSRQPQDFTRGLFRELCRRGYDLAPVNPEAAELEGRRCFARVQDIAPPVDGVLLLTSPRVTEAVVRDCAEAGVRRVWMHQGAGVGAVSEAAVRFCQEHGIAVVAGWCPYMFLPEAGWFHRLHGWLRRRRTR